MTRLLTITSTLTVTVLWSMPWRVNSTSKPPPEPKAPLLRREDLSYSGDFISGTIVDESRLPMAGAIITVPNVVGGTVSDINGYFSLALPKGGAISIRGSRSNAAEYYVDGVRVGTPGAASSIKIRGISGMVNYIPVYVVDGIVVPNINNLTDEQITSIEVLIKGRVQRLNQSLPHLASPSPSIAPAPAPTCPVLWKTNCLKTRLASYLVRAVKNPC